MVKYEGSKMLKVPFLLKHFPKKHGKFVEVFGGMGWLTLLKKPSKVDVWNDIDNNLYSVFYVLATNPDALLHRIEYTPMSRQVYEWAKEVVKSEGGYSMEDRAFATLYVLAVSFPARLYGNSFISNCRVSMNDWQLIRRKIWYVINRLKDVVIEHKDWSWMLAHYNCPTTLLFLDPPYVDTTQRYKHQFTQENLSDLLDVLVGHKGYFMMTYSGNKYLLEFAKKHGWVVQEIPQPKKTISKKYAKDYLITNYDEFITWDYNEGVEVFETRNFKLRR